MKLKIADIQIGERSRSGVRNVEPLAASIRDHTLIHPPTVRRVGDRWVLVSGARRLAAMQSLGWDETPVTVAETIDDELAALYAEGDENIEREPFTVAEAVEHRRRIREREAEAAKERQRQAITERDEQGRAVATSSNLEEVATAEQPAHERTTRHRTAKATGYGATTLDKAEKIMSLAEDDSQPEPVRQVAEHSAEKLAKPGVRVDKEFKRVQQAQQDGVAAARTTRATKSINATAEKQGGVLDRTITALGGFAEATRKIETLHPGITNEEAAHWEDDLSKAVTEFRRLTKLLKERSSGQPTV